MELHSIDPHHVQVGNFPYKVPVKKYEKTAALICISAREIQKCQHTVDTWRGCPLGARSRDDDLLQLQPVSAHFRSPALPNFLPPPPALRAFIPSTWRWDEWRISPLDGSTTTTSHHPSPVGRVPLPLPPPPCPARGGHPAATHRIASAVFSDPWRSWRGGRRNRKSNEWWRREWEAGSKEGGGGGHGWVNASSFASDSFA